MTTINSDVAISDLSSTGDDDTGADAFLDRFMPDGDPAEPKKKVPSEEDGETKPKEKTTPDPEPDEEDPEKTPGKTKEGEEEQETDPPKDKTFADGDETYVKIKVGEEEHEVSVKDLKRLWGQEESLTRKSQEVADLRKKADAETTRVVEGYNKLLERAKAKAEPFTKINFLVAAKELNAEDLKALTEEAQRCFDDVKFLEGGLNEHLKEINTKQSERIVEDAKACIKALNDPENSNHIPEWSDKVYGELREFAVKQGFSKDIFNQLVDPSALKMIHMASLYEKGKSKVLTKVINKSPKKIMKSSRTATSSKPDQAKADKAMERLKRDGGTDDAAEAFLARWNANSDE